MPKHTPGPWSSDRIRDDRFEINSEGTPWKAVATVTANRDGSGKVGNDEARANAQLIASSPDLLEHLQRLVNIATNPAASKEDIRTIAAEARDTLAKACSKK